jgi:classical protein kinase C
LLQHHQQPRPPLRAPPRNTAAIMNDDEKILGITKKIEREKALINAANLMRQQTNNEAVRSKLDTQMREGRRNLEFFEERLRELQMRRATENMSLGGSTLGSFNTEQEGEDNGAPAPPPKDASGYPQYGQGDLMPPRAPFPGQPPHSGTPKARPNFTKLGRTHPRAGGLQDFTYNTC